MIKIIALIGKSGAGKDALLKRVLAKHPEYNNLISYTTRPPRSNEVHGRDYYFIDVPTFEEMTLSGMMLEAQAFNGWFYGKGIANLSKTRINIGVFSPAGIESLLMYDDIDLKVFYIQAKDKIRIKRQLDREENPDIEEIFRRYETDEEDFNELNFPYEVVLNNKKADINKAIKQIVSFS